MYVCMYSMYVLNGIQGSQSTSCCLGVADIGRRRPLPLDDSKVSHLKGVCLLAATLDESGWGSSPCCSPPLRCSMSDTAWTHRCKPAVIFLTWTALCCYSHLPMYRHHLHHHGRLVALMLLLLVSLLLLRQSHLMAACESVRQSATSPAAPWATSWPWSPAVACPSIRQCDNDSAATSRAWWSSNWRRRCAPSPPLDTAISVGTPKQEHKQRQGQKQRVWLWLWVWVRVSNGSDFSQGQLQIGFVCVAAVAL